jgi:chaperonin cofactor prefoldin
MPQKRGSLQNSGGGGTMTELEKQWAELEAKIQWLMHYCIVLQEENDELRAKIRKLLLKYEEPKCQN